MDILVEEGVTSLQAVHGLPRRLLQRRRPDPAGHAARRRQRRPGHDARRERHRHRRPRRAGARRAAAPTRATTARSARPCWRPRPPTGPSSSPGSPARPLYVVHVSAQEAARRAGRRPRPGPAGLRRDLPAVPLPVHRQPRRAGLRGRQVRVLARRCARGSTRPRSGGPAHQRPPGGLHRPLPVLLHPALLRGEVARPGTRAPAAPARRRSRRRRRARPRDPRPRPRARRQGRRPRRRRCHRRRT